MQRWLMSEGEEFQGKRNSDIMAEQQQSDQQILYSVKILPPSKQGC